MPCEQGDEEDEDRPKYFTVSGTIRVIETYRFTASLTAKNAEEAADIILDEAPLAHEFRSNRKHDIEWHEDRREVPGKLWEAEWAEPPLVEEEKV